MTRAFALLLAALALLLPGGGALAQSGTPSGARVVATTSWVEEWDPASGQWVRVEEDPAALRPVAAIAATTVSRIGNVTITETVTHELVRFIARPPRVAAQDAGVARFGPFRVLDGKRAALVAATDAAAPQAFAAMLAAYPGLEVIEFADASGTSNDLANLRVGRAIRAAGLATHVPEGGSARSGAVELFLAGTRRTIAPGALFAVHSWRDEAGREPADFAPDAPENRLYLDYYTEMGMSAEEARAFYAMTNSVPHAGALWLEGAQMARWIALEVAPMRTAPRTPAARILVPEAEAGLRRALARSGSTLIATVRAPWAMPRRAPAASTIAPRLAPRLAYTNLGAGLLDSGPSFP